jgi:hypothetical protein
MQKIEKRVNFCLVDRGKASGKHQLAAKKSSDAVAVNSAINARKRNLSVPVSEGSGDGSGGHLQASISAETIYPNLV